MNKIPKEIVDKIEQRNALDEEIEVWCKNNLDTSGIDSKHAEITEEHTGKEQGTEECREWCDQTWIYEDWYRGNYYWETEYDGKFLCMEFEV